MRDIKKHKLKNKEVVSGRYAKLLIGYKEYDTKFIKKPKDWKKWRDTQYKPKEFLSKNPKPNLTK